jgi:hypothetical protein
VVIKKVGRAVRAARANMPAPCGGLVGGDFGGLVGLIFLAGVATAGEPELAARMLPRLAGAVPMEAKLRQSLADGGRGLLAERNPNPLADYLGQFPQAAVLLLEQGQNLVSGQGAVFLACFRVNRQTCVRLVRAGLANGCARHGLLNCADLLLSPGTIFL